MRKRYKNSTVFITSIVLMILAVVFVTFRSPKVDNVSETTRAASLGINPEPWSDVLDDNISEEEFYSDPINEREIQIYKVIR